MESEAETTLQAFSREDLSIAQREAPAPTPLEVNASALKSEDRPVDGWTSYRADRTPYPERTHPSPLPRSASHVCVPA
jgi:hypothetical protein